MSKKSSTFAPAIRKNKQQNRRKSGIVKQLRGRFFRLYGAIAQLVEQRTENPCVTGSIPVGTTKKTAHAVFFCIRGKFSFPSRCHSLFCIRGKFCFPSRFHPLFAQTIIHSLSNAAFVLTYYRTRPQWFFGEVRHPSPKQRGVDAAHAHCV